MKKRLLPLSALLMLSMLFACSKKDTTPDASATSSTTSTSSSTSTTSTTGTNNTNYSSPTDAATRAKVVNNYNTNYLGTNTIPFTWNGDTTQCKEGSLTTTQLNSVLQRINFFRSLCGLSNVSFADIYNIPAQKSALMMRVNHSLNHTPPSSWKCYTTDGATAAGMGNLSYDSYATLPISIDDWMSDDGSTNYPAGHRRWILYPKSVQFGFGSTGDFAVLYIANRNGSSTSTYPFVSWPCMGFVPAKLIYNRWSFSYPGADFTGASVSIKDQNNNAIPCTLETQKQGYGDNTIVWRPSGIITNSTSDLTYHISINNFSVNGKSQGANYDVVIIQP